MSPSALAWAIGAEVVAGSEPHPSRSQLGGYEDSPACKLLAVSCACCGRPLVDAQSVECGVGPECRKKHGYGDASLPPNWVAALPHLAKVFADLKSGDIHNLPGRDPREVCNVLVHGIAAELSDGLNQDRICAIAALGFVKLAERCAKHAGPTVHVHLVAGGRYEVKAPFNEAFNAAARGVRGSQWHKELKVRSFPVDQRLALFAAINNSFPRGSIVVGDRGFKIL